MVTAMYYHMFPAEGEGNPACTCEWGRDEDMTAACAA
jgi:hypothetical protein